MGITYHFSPYSCTRSPSHSHLIYSLSHLGHFQASTHSVHFRHSSILISPPPLGTGECTFLISLPTRAQGPSKCRNQSHESMGWEIYTEQPSKWVQEFAHFRPAPRGAPVRCWVASSR
ncbi:hypothetical protein PAPYR_8790 [Paratrimastix pyriformis]|uniref:Uncharacterized protein n=1 Tax=Paratrimastix pyriformis TaxID=342808 RepID=A0ABQ8U9V7_9EUKA|nr:hypothetical protein PAPYR_8790 [Paratrimastix pyriformis]